MRKKRALQSMVWVLFGTFILAFSYYHINFQNNLVEGGFVGLALLAKYAFDFSPAVTILFLDIPIILVALFIKGRLFIVNTAISTGAFALFYDMCERFSPLTLVFQQNMLLAAILSGIFTGLGAGIVLRFGGASGGDDILALFLSRWTGFKIGMMFFVLDFVVLLFSLAYMPLTNILYTILAVSIGAKVITWTVDPVLRKKTQPQIAISATH